MNETMQIYKSWRKYLTPVWWRIQLASLISGRPPLNIIATFSVDAPVNIENIDDHQAYACHCGSVHFNLLKSGNIECSGCGERGLFIYGVPCPKCNGIDTGTRRAGANTVADECICEICHECGHEWNHR